MNLNYYESYLNGIFDLAKNLVDNLKMSETLVECYKKDTYQEDIYKRHKIEIETIPLIEIKKSKEKVLKDWFVYKKVVSKILFILERRLKDPKNFYRIKNTIDKDNVFKKNKPFYFVENILIIEFEEYILWLSMGDFE